MRKGQLATLALVAACVTTLAAIAGWATAGPFTVAPLTLISGPSPFPSCNIGPGATNYLNAEVEPWVAVNPADPSNIIGVYQQDRWSDGGGRGLVASVTHDGGATWSARSLRSRSAPADTPGTAATSSGLPIRGDVRAERRRLSDRAQLQRERLRERDHRQQVRQTAATHGAR